MEPDKDRPRGILTERDRAYLRERDLPEKRQAKYERKRTCRERIENSLLDFYDILQLPTDERRKLFKDMQLGDEMYTALEHMVALSHYACGDAGLDFEEFLADAIETAAYAPHPDEGEYPPIVRASMKQPDVDAPQSAMQAGSRGSLTGEFRILRDVTVDIDYEYEEAYDLEILESRFDEGETLTAEELGILLRNGRIDEEDLAQFKDQTGE